MELMAINPLLFRYAGIIHDLGLQIMFECSDTKIYVKWTLLMTYSEQQLAYSHFRSMGWLLFR